MMLGAQCPILRTLFIVLIFFVLRNPYPIIPAVHAAEIARTLFLVKSLLVNDLLDLLISFRFMKAGL